MATPVVARGWFEHADDGGLIRHQTEPRAETVEIGQGHIHHRRDASGFSTTVSIPSEMAPVFDILRGIVTGDREGLAELSRDIAATIENGDAGWTLTLAADLHDGTSNIIVLGGCGDVLETVELQLADGSRRRYVFEEAP